MPRGRTRRVATRDPARGGDLGSGEELNLTVVGSCCQVEIKPSVDSVSSIVGSFRTEVAESLERSMEEETLDRLQLQLKRKCLTAKQKRSIQGKISALCKKRAIADEAKLIVNNVLPAGALIVKQHTNECISRSNSVEEVEIKPSVDSVSSIVGSFRAEVAESVERCMEEEILDRLQLQLKRPALAAQQKRSIQRKISILCRKRAIADEAKLMVNNVLPAGALIVEQNTNQCTLRSNSVEQTCLRPKRPTLNLRQGRSSIKKLSGMYGKNERRASETAEVPNLRRGQNKTKLLERTENVSISSILKIKTVGTEDNERDEDVVMVANEQCVNNFVTVKNETSLNALRNGDWINDEVIVTYLNNLQNSSNLSVPFTYVDVIVWGMIFEEEENVGNYIRGNIEESTYMFFPIHQGSEPGLPANHFTLFVYHMEREVGIFYDPMGNRLPAHIRQKLLYMLQKLRLKNVITEARVGSYNKQMDAVNCGIHVLHIITRMVQGQPVLEENFNPFSYREHVYRVITGTDANVAAIPISTSEPMEQDCGTNNLPTDNVVDAEEETKVEICPTNLEKVQTKVSPGRKRNKKTPSIVQAKKLKEVKLEDVEIRRLKKELADCRKRLKVIKLKPNETKEQYQVRINTAREKQNLIKYLLKPGRFLQATQQASDSDWFRVNFSKKCPHCGAIKSTREAPALCCQLGKVQLDPYPSLPSPLYEYYMVPQFPGRSQFIRYIRRLNSTFSLCCVRDSKDKPEFVKHGNKGGSLRIVGKIEHQFYSLKPREGCLPVCGQLYYMDTEDALKERKKRAVNRPISERLLMLIDGLLRKYNPHVQAYIQMAEMERREQELAKQENRKTVDLALRLLVPDNKEGLQRKVYALPTTKQIAIIYKPGIDNRPEHPGFTVFSTGNRGNVGNDLSYMSPYVDPLAYPLLFPYGTFGFIPYFQKRCGKGTRQRISMREYYAYRLFERNDNNKSYHLHGQTLTEQFIIDACVRNDANRLEYYKKHQADLSKEKAKYAVQAVKEEKELMPNAKKGMAFFMPSDFQGAYEFVRQRQIHMMATFHLLGKPDFFITFTCNQNWPEITERIRTDLGETAYSRPDVTVRVMHEKIDQFVKLVKDEEALGPAVAVQCVIEFQKRGLPHAHCLIVLDRQHKLETAEDVDQFITAEIPDPQEDPKFYENVKKYQIHGPCGNYGKYEQCQVEDDKRGPGVCKCSAKFPMPYSEGTVIVRNQYPRYRRPNNGRTVTNKNGTADNRFVVPTNRFLSLSMDCHINVEDCFNLKCAANYLAKYLCKPTDKASVQFYEMQRRKTLENRRRQPGNANLHDYKILDERRDIEFIQDVRFISSMESVQELLGFPLQKMTTVPYVLPVHDEHEQNIYFHCDGNENEEILMKAGQETQLTAYFKAAATNKFAGSLKYVEFPRWYAWDSRKKQWNCRNKEDEKVIPRLQEALRTVNGVYYDEYVDACNALGLFKDNKEWEQCLEQAVPLKRPFQLRQLFIVMLAFCQVHDSTRLFNKFKDALSRDLKHEEHRYSLAYSKIVTALRRLNKTPADVGLQFHIDSDGEGNESLIQQMHVLEIIEDNGNADNEMFADMHECEEIAQKAVVLLNCDQRKIFDAVIAAVESADASTPRLFRIAGSGGTGKTFLLNTIIRHCRGLGIYPVVSASTGTAATLLVSGRTAHSAFGIPLQLSESSTSAMKRHSERADILRNSTLIIIDEVTMLNKFVLQLVDQLLRDLAVGNASNLPFGGRTVILGGDFKQLLPVVVGGYRSEVVSQAIFNSDLFQLFTPLNLQLNMRSGKAHVDYANWLLNLGKGELNDERNRVTLPDETVIDSMQELLDFTFDGFRTELTDDEMSSRVILSPRNVDTSDLNEIILQRMYPSREIVSYFSHDEPLETENPEDLCLIEELPIECYYNANPSGFPPHALRLKVGLTVLLLRNLNVDEGLVNGTRLCITACRPNLIETRVITGASKGNTLFLCRLEFQTPYNGTELGLRFKRLQFPIRAGSAMTINKAQGQTFTKIGLNLQQQVFSHGQLYVAFSRVSSFENVRVFTGGVKDLDGKTRVRNIVYPEVLDSTES